MNQQNLLIICITVILCVAILSVTALTITNNKVTSENNTTNNTNETNLTLNDTNNTTTETTQKSTTKTSKQNKESRVREEDKITPDGWDPKKHEVSREQYENGMERVYYDDGYTRVVDKKGNILSYGYGSP